MRRWSSGGSVESAGPDRVFGGAGSDAGHGLCRSDAVGFVGAAGIRSLDRAGRRARRESDGGLGSIVGWLVGSFVVGSIAGPGLGRQSDSQAIDERPNDTDITEVQTVRSQDSAQVVKRIPSWSCIAYGSLGLLGDALAEEDRISKHGSGLPGLVALSVSDSGQLRLYAPLSAHQRVPG